MGKLGMRGSFAHEKRDPISRKKEENGGGNWVGEVLYRLTKSIKVEMKRGFTADN
jgi:hypothetical protein